MSMKRETPAEQLARLRRALTTPDAVEGVAFAIWAFGNGLDPNTADPQLSMPIGKKR